MVGEYLWRGSGPKRLKTTIYISWQLDLFGQGSCLSLSFCHSFLSPLGSVLIVWVRGSISIKPKKAGEIGNKIIGFCNYHSIFFNIASMKPT